MTSIGVKVLLTNGAERSSEAPRGTRMETKKKIKEKQARTTSKRHHFPPAQNGRVWKLRIKGPILLCVDGSLATGTDRYSKNK